MTSRTGPGSVTAASGTNTVPAAYRSRSRSPTATASRVLPTPPGPVSVTSRTWGWPIKSATSSIACSRPTSDVMLTGSGRRPRAAAREGGAGAAAGRLATVNRSVSSAARSSRASRPSSAGVWKWR
jgi:hypothetical protein